MSSSGGKRRLCLLGASRLDTSTPATATGSLSRREAAGTLFAGFCKEPKDGGLKGITFRAENSVKIGNTFATQWVATAPFLAEPYKGSDAYIIENGYLRAMVSTFDGNALKIVK